MIRFKLIVAIIGIWWGGMSTVVIALHCFPQATRFLTVPEPAPPCIEPRVRLDFMPFTPQPEPTKAPAPSSEVL